MGLFDKVRLYVLLTESLCRGDWYATAEAALIGGAGAIQLREKHLGEAELLDRAKRLRVLCDEHRALFILNDRPDIALAAGAHGVHVGQQDMSTADARRLLGSEFIVGLSTHTIQQAQAALVDPPDYLAVGPMFRSPTKPQRHLAGPDTLNAVRNITLLPLVAIGGITADNADQLGAADVLAVCGSIIGAQDVAAATRELLATMAVARCG